jgi:hypothetical protein
MAAKNRNGKRSDAGVTIQLHLLGIVVFSVSLVLASALMTFGFVKVHEAGEGDGNFQKHYAATNSNGTLETEMTNVPPWGQLTERDIDLEQPEEYAAYETDTNETETWTFEGMNPDAVLAVMQSSGLSEEQIGKVMSAACMVYTNSSTVITPDSNLVIALPPDVRAKLYAMLGQFKSNELMQFPFCFPGNSFYARVDKSHISAATLSILEKMLYTRGDAKCFSDLETLLRGIPDEAGRLQVVEALSHQSAVLLAIHVWPDSDIDNILDYWSWPAGVRVMDVRPFLDALKREPDGGGASILYFLPPFARSRLYTYPLPAQPGDPAMDCHWSTMNFFNETPDNRFSDPQYTVSYILAHYYKIAEPTMYGDLVFLLNKKGDAIHSAVYLAGDIVFTKNGNNSAQPWMLMHLKDLLAEYTVDGPPDVVVYRNKNS